MIESESRRWRVKVGDGGDLFGEIKGRPRCGVGVRWNLEMKGEEQKGFPFSCSIHPPSSSLVLSSIGLPRRRLLPLAFPAAASASAP
ncbi:hypothetical protein Droror1_Dr00018124, partial [Drosera rotundifolia]